MDPERWKKIEALFESAVARPPAERAALLDKLCGGDAALRKEVESLLAHQQPTGQLIPTLVNQAARLFPGERTMPGGDSRFIPGTVLATRYRVIGLLGKGGMGEVYRADDLKLGQPVALKFLPEKLAKDPTTLSRFHREVRVARQVTHPNICRVFDIGEIEGHHFLSMEYIDGEDLSTLLRRIGRLPSDKAVEIARQLCAGLATAHEEGVLHRDLKPANIMIDGRGKARITDFGLAGLAEDFQGNDVFAGTPAYMAPEQLAGREVSIKSDIYSLGLVLYELFTGRKVFEATTLEDLIRQRESTPLPSISSYVKEVDPLVERVILRCLEKDPTDRPSSVAQVAAALPGGDPLAAALAAGETPSPEMVAAASKEGALRPVAAVALLASILIALASVVLFSGRVRMHNHVRLDKSPEVLAERASTIANRFGYSVPPADTAYGFDVDDSYLEYVKEHDESFADWENLARGQPLTIYYWYRQSPYYMEPLGMGKVSPSDPPLTLTDMVSIRLDTRGRLVEFYGVPPQLDEALAPQPVVDWSPLFIEAGLDIKQFAATDPKWVPPTGYDARGAWQGVYAESAEIPVRVEAATFRGRPVYFQIIPSWQKPLRQQPALLGGTVRAAFLLLFSTFLAVLIGGILLARRNLRLGRGDRKGAFRLALFVLWALIIGWLIGADHVPTLSGEISVVFTATAWALSYSVFLWLLYIALEPYVRRRWPRLLISWSRLMTGAVRDPMVGRDILVGALLGVGHTIAIYFLYYLSSSFNRVPILVITGDLNRHGVRGLASALLCSSVPMSLASGLFSLFLLLLLFSIVRRHWLAAFGMWLIVASIETLMFAIPSGVPLWVAPVVPMMIAGLLTIATARFGLLTTIIFQLCFTLSFHYPITPDLSSWHAGTTIFSLVIIIGLVVYGFYTSLAGQQLFRGGILQE